MPSLQLMLFGRESFHALQKQGVKLRNLTVRCYLCKKNTKLVIMSVVKCKMCGENFSPDSNFCPKCGTPVMRNEPNVPNYTVETILKVVGNVVLFFGVVLAVVCLFVIDEDICSSIAMPRHWALTFIPQFTEEAVFLAKTAFSVFMLLFSAVSWGVLWGIAEISTSLKKNSVK